MIRIAKRYFNYCLGYRIVGHAPDGGCLNLNQKVTMKPTRLTIGLFVGSLAAVFALAMSTQATPSGVASVLGYVGVAGVVAIALADYRFAARRLNLK